MWKIIIFLILLNLIVYRHHYDNYNIYGYSGGIIIFDSADNVFDTNIKDHHNFDRSLARFHIEYIGSLITYRADGKLHIFDILDHDFVLSY